MGISEQYNKTSAMHNFEAVSKKFEIEPEPRSNTNYTNTDEK
jgi:hypothetical protein